MLRRRASVGLAAQMLGGAEQAFEDTLEYLKVREQFDAPIGAFQALQRLRDRDGAKAALADFQRLATNPRAIAAREAGPFRCTNSRTRRSLIFESSSDATGELVMSLLINYTYKVSIRKWRLGNMGMAAIPIHLSPAHRSVGSSITSCSG